MTVAHASFAAMATSTSINYTDLLENDVRTYLIHLWIFVDPHDHLEVSKVEELLLRIASVLLVYIICNVGLIYLPKALLSGKKAADARVGLEGDFSPTRYAMSDLGGRVKAKHFSRWL
jgi:hypothetical protein